MKDYASEIWDKRIWLLVGNTQSYVWCMFGAVLVAYSSAFIFYGGVEVNTHGAQLDVSTGPLPEVHPPGFFNLYTLLGVALLTLLPLYTLVCCRQLYKVMERQDKEVSEGTHLKDYGSEEWGRRIWLLVGRTSNYIRSMLCIAIAISCSAYLFHVGIVEGTRITLEGVPMEVHAPEFLALNTMIVIPMFAFSPFYFLVCFRQLYKKMEK